MRTAALWQLAAWTASPKLGLAQLLTLIDIPGRRQWDRLGERYEDELRERDEELAVKARRIAELEAQAASVWAGAPPPTQTLGDDAGDDVGEALAALEWWAQIHGEGERLSGYLLPEHGRQIDRNAGEHELLCFAAHVAMLSSSTRARLGSTITVLQRVVRDYAARVRPAADPRRAPLRVLRGGGEWRWRDGS